MIHNFSKFLLKSFTNNSRYRFADSFVNTKRQKQAKLAKKLKQTFKPTFLQVIDTTLSGSSCGQMYKIIIESPVFEGKTRVAQHQMVSECLQQDLKSIHAFNLKTKVPKKTEQQSEKPTEQHGSTKN